MAAPPPRRRPADSAALVALPGHRLTPVLGVLLALALIAPGLALPARAADTASPAAAAGGEAGTEEASLSILPRLSRDQRLLLAQIESYLNGIDTAQARFLQIASTGNYAEGILYLQRPNRMRLQYAPPAELLMVANGSHLVYYDRELDQVSYIALGDTPLGVLLRETIRFDDPAITITDLRETEGVVEVVLIQTKDPSQGALTLVFARNPIELRQWRVLDSQNTEVAVSLFNIRQGVAMDRSLFIFDQTEERPRR